MTSLHRLMLLLFATVTFAIAMTVTTRAYWVCDWCFECRAWDGNYCYDGFYYECCEWYPEDPEGDPPPPPPEPGTVNITGADIREDVITIYVGPSNVMGVLSVRAVRSDGGTTTLFDGGVPGGQTHLVSFKGASLPAGRYVRVEAKWNPGTGEVSNNRTVAFSALGPYRHSQYNTPSESVCSETTGPYRVSMDEVSCQPSEVHNLRTQFASKVTLNGSGIGINVGPIQKSYFCRSRGPSDFTKVSEIRGSNGPVNDYTVAVIPNHPAITWGDEVKIINGGTSLFKRVTDTCANDPAEGCVIAQLDNYNANAIGCTAKAVGWDLGTFPTILLR